MDRCGVRLGVLARKRQSHRSRFYPTTPCFPFCLALTPWSNTAAAMDRDESPSPSTPSGGSDSSSGGTKFGDGMLAISLRLSKITI
jgi:hypothetical protein